MTLITVLLCLAYLAWLVAERQRVRRYRRLLQHVIHVNGTRGKSSVCRLIDAGLRAGGYSVLTKTTGTWPAVLDADGKERPLRRIGPPSIREQMDILREAARQKVQVLVIECMAVRPEYQDVSERLMLRSDIGVLTNVRPDHAEEMGEGLDAVAEALGHAIPHNGVLITGEIRYRGFLRSQAAERGSTLIVAECRGDEEGAIDHPENVALALAVCARLGVERSVAVAGMRAYRRDPGAFRVEVSRAADGSRRILLNAMAANDPGSAGLLLDRVEREGLMDRGRRLLLINNRRDRPARMLQFAEFAGCNAHRFDGFVLTGAFRWLARRALLKHGVAPGRIAACSSLAGLDTLEGPGGDQVVFAVGNIVGTGFEHPADDVRSGAANGR